MMMALQDPALQQGAMLQGILADDGDGSSEEEADQADQKETAAEPDDTSEPDTTEGSKAESDGGVDAGEPVYDEEADEYLNLTLRSAEQIFAGEKASDLNVSGITTENAFSL